MQFVERRFISYELGSLLPPRGEQEFTTPSGPVQPSAELPISERSGTCVLNRLLTNACYGTFLFAGFCLLSSAVSPVQQGRQMEETNSLDTQDHSVQPGTPAKPEQEPKDKELKKNKKRRGSFVAAPIPISSPAIGSGVVPVAAYIFPLVPEDHVSPPSVVGAAGLITNNGSRGFAVGGDLYFKENTYEITAIYTHGNVNYNLYGLGSGVNIAGFKLPLAQTGQAFLGEALRRIAWKFFLGPRFLSGNSLITLRRSGSVGSEIPPDLGLQTNLRAIGIQLQRDTRPNRFYPTAGTYFHFTSDFFAHGLGSKYAFQSYRLTFNKYASLTKNQVLAYNLYACGTGGTPPFYGNCIYGTNNELRGYTAGRYLDRYMTATQLEYRLTLPKRFGVVGFGGIGEVIPGGNQIFRSNHFLPSVGGGLRFELSKVYHVNLSADYGKGRGGHTFSLGLGEAF